MNSLPSSRLLECMRETVASMIGLVLGVVVGSGPGKHGEFTSQTVSQAKFAHFPLDEGDSRSLLT